MIGRQSACLIAAVVGAAFLAGCGSSASSTSSSQSTSTAAPTSPAAAGTTSTSATSTPSSATGGVNSAALQQAVAACRTAIQAAPSLPANVKAKAEGVCNKASSGDLEGARKAAKEVCVEVINASPVPSAYKEQALAACKAK